MSQRIIYKTPEGDLAVIIPSPRELEVHTIQDIAQKDVPSGVSYKIIDEDDLPTDRTFRNAWTIADDQLTDGSGSQNDVFVEDPKHPDYVAPEQPEPPEVDSDNS